MHLIAVEVFSCELWIETFLDEIQCSSFTDSVPYAKEVDLIAVEVFSCDYA